MAQQVEARRFRVPRGSRRSGIGMNPTSTKVFEGSSPRRMFLDGVCKPGSFEISDEALRFEITGTRGNHDAWVNIPQRHVIHSPTGFEWGYGGSGPADFALNVLALFLFPSEAWRLHQPFKWDVIARLDRASFTLSAFDVIEWVRQHWQQEIAGEQVRPCTDC